jgi:phosphoglycerate dehydrogenase-like enzyme
MRAHWPRPPAGCQVGWLDISTGEVPGPLDVLVCGHPREGEVEAVVEGGAVVIPFAGLSPALRERLLRRPDLRVYALHENASDVAELGLGLLLALARHVVSGDRALREGRWERGRLGVRLAGKRVLLLGYGAIGRALATRLLALGMFPRALRRRGPFGHDQVAEVHPETSLEALLPEADVLINTLPLTPNTEGMLDAHRLGLLPDGALFVNLGRGATVVEADLYAALTEGTLGGAALDVWWRYGGERPCHFDFEALDHVVFSPHRGGQVTDTETDRAAAVDAVLRQLAAGEEPPGRVDVEQGY